MELRDLLVTPVLIFVTYLVAFFIRPSVTDAINRKYFIPALTLRIIGALAVGFIYQFYYHGGDTYNFHTHGSRHLWEAFIDSPESGLQLIFGDSKDVKGVYRYTSQIPFFHDKSSYTIIRIAAFFDLFTFSTYSATALCFAVISFIGSWMLFLTFYKERSAQVKPIAFATLFIPSVFFWGSGLLKDTVTLAAIGIATYLMHQIFIKRNFGLFKILMLLFVLLIVFIIKKYILICFLPAALLWVALRLAKQIQSPILRILVLPFLISMVLISGTLAVQQVGKDDSRYSLERLGETARITAYDIAFQTGREAGSTYSLGELDGSFATLVKLSPQAVNVSLFRPYMWEVRNPLMLISAMESLALLLVTIYVILRSFHYLPKIVSNPDILFCLLFSLTFAFAVGVSTFNFGTLSRYKIPLLPFYSLALMFIYFEANKERKLDALAITE